MKIDKINIYVCQVKSSGFNYSTWKNSVNETVVYEVIAGDYTGWGEATAKYHGLLFAKAMCKRLIGKTVSNPDKMLDGIFKDNLLYEWMVGFNRPHRQVREGISFALYDLLGKVEKKSIAELVDRKVVKESIECMPVIHVNEPSRMKEIAQAWTVDGFSTFKVKLRGDANKDVEAIKAILSVNEKTRVYVVDANYGYTDEDELMHAGTELSKLGVHYFQNPIKKHLKFYPQLSNDMNMSFTCDNTSYWPNIKRVMKYKAAKLSNLHPNCLGGVDLLFKTVDCSAKNGVESIMGSSGWLGIQDKSYQKLAFLLEGQHPTEEIGMDLYFASERKKFYNCEGGLPEVLSNPLEISDGIIFNDKSYGFGIEVDRDKLNEKVTQTISYS